jgi:hypothetical protein
MKNTITLFFCLLLLTVCSTFASGQTKSKRASNLKTVINQYAAKTVRTLNRTGSMGKYKVENKSTFNSDVDGDGDFDAVVEIFFCEYDSCHPTTNSSKLVVFLNNNGTYRFAADKGFVLYGKINSVEDDKIYVDVYSLEEDDPQCCPQLKRSEAYSFKGNRLVKAKR